MFSQLHVTLIKIKLVNDIFAWLIFIETCFINV